MTIPPNRREFLRHLLALSAAGTLGSACASKPPPATSLPSTAAPATAAQPMPARPTAAPAVAPTTSARLAAATAQPDAAPATPTSQPGAPPSYLAVARGPGADPGELVRRAVAALGGIERFVKERSDVIIKPNICNAYHGPEYASTTNPDVVSALVALCLAAGARRVRVMDSPFGGSPQASYATSGIEEAVKKAGGQMAVMSQMKYRKIALPEGKSIKEWQVYGDILDADVVINVPIAKTHGSAQLTLGMKNLMGVIEDRGGFHSRGLHQCIADLSSAVKPQLTVVDAVRILAGNGPTGGSLDDVKRMDTVIASADVVAADAYAATLFGLQGKEINYIRIAAEMGLGRMDLDAIKIEEIAA